MRETLNLVVLLLGTTDLEVSSTLEADLVHAGTLVFLSGILYTECHCFIIAVTLSRKGWIHHPWIHAGDNNIIGVYFDILFQYHQLLPY
jgi:hypothetical protein